MKDHSDQSKLLRTPINWREIVQDFISALALAGLIWGALWL